MRRLIGSLLLALAAPAGACPNPVPGDSICVSWRAPTLNVDGTPLTDLAAFSVYWGDSPGAYTNAHRVEDPRATWFVIPQVYGRKYIAATAWNAEGAQSAFSNEVARQGGSILYLAPSPPSNFNAALTLAEDYKVPTVHGSPTINNTGGAALSSLTTAHTHPVEADRVILVYSFSGTTSGNVEDGASATYGGAPMTSLGRKKHFNNESSGSNGTRIVEIFALDVAGSGSAANLVVNLENANRFSVFVLSVSGAGQVRSVEEYERIGPAFNGTWDIATQSGDLVVTALAWRNSGSSLTSLTGTQFDDQGINGQGSRGGGSHLLADSTTTTLDILWDSNSGAFAALAVAFEPAPVGGLEITSFDPAPPWTVGQSGVRILGSGFGE